MRDSAWISILGIYNHYPDVFDNLVIPRKSELRVEDWIRTDIPDLDKTLAINHILMNLAEMPLVYNKPDVLKTMIGIWSSVRKPVWAALYETTAYKYVPIWNKDGTIVTDREREHEQTSAGTLTDTTSGSGTISGTHSDTSTTETTTGGTIAKTTVTDQDETDGYTKTTDQDTTGTSAGTESRHTVIDTDTTNSATSSETVNEDRTVQHDVTGFDTDSYAHSTQDVTDATTTTSGSTSGSGTVDTDETVSGTTSGTTSGTNDITETNAGTHSNDIEVTENGTTTGESTTEFSGSGTTGQTSATSGSLERETGGNVSGTENESTTIRETGNIGITTSQAMIREERELVLLNLYDVICEDFKRQFCLMIY